MPGEMTNVAISPDRKLYVSMYLEPPRYILDLVHRGRYRRRVVTRSNMPYRRGFFIRWKLYVR